jgi:predicted signal transduction protein with EAL and GGDEF domain
VTRATEMATRWRCCSATSTTSRPTPTGLAHTAGHRALRAVSGVLLRWIRQVDLAARYRGEEFTVILFDTTSAGALEVAERIRSGVTALDLGGPERGLTVGVRVATLPADAALTAELGNKADWAMYLAARQGRDRVLPFGPRAQRGQRGAGDDVDRRPPHWRAYCPAFAAGTQ